ncbi:hypothetical protein ACA910_011989 [Epithemia clementina (nom. ined.)]
MFADIVGFTAWSSAREPKQVFTLLESIYQAFDKIANRHKVFKVDTVGDCYVAVAGLPEPRNDHAVVMARFARDCLYGFQALCPQLEVILGPDTADLAMRVGLHSGPVTAGVLRGQRARFQLFGDTMNTASRMETTSRPHRIQVSQETADLLGEANRGHWCHKRVGTVEAKGKGTLQTYWLDVRGGHGSSASDHSNHVKESTSSGDDMEVGNGATKDLSKISINKPLGESGKLREKTDRLIRWNVEILTRTLEQVQERRLATGLKHDSPEKLCWVEQNAGKNGMVLDEVQDIVKLSPSTTYLPRKTGSPRIEKVQLPTLAKKQLENYITEIAASYRNNPFHNFEHASHVTMSVVKLMSRVMTPLLEAHDDDSTGTEQMLHDHAYRITSDPLTQFACALSAVIHDIDHCGVPNAQLVREQNPIALRFKNKSVAE